MRSRMNIASAKSRPILALLMLGALGAWPTVSAAADAAPVVQQRIFVPADFARFAPRNAYEMLEKVPGFVVREPDEQQRGLGQVGANVLLNGQRLPGKDDVETELGRVPAASVVRIEIVDAATLNIAGLTGQIANIVAKAGARSGQYSWRPEFRNHVTHPLLTRFDVSLSGVMGPVEYTIAVANEANRSGAGGPTRILGPDGRLRELRKDRWRGSSEQPRLTGRFVIDGPGSSVGNLNVSWRGVYYDYRERGLWTGPGLPDRDHIVRQDEDDYSYEIGGSYEFALGGGRLKLIGLDRFEHDPVLTDAVTHYAGGAPADGSRFDTTGDTTERIVRAEYNHLTPFGDGQLSLERAVNRLDNVSRLYALDTAGGFTPVDLPGGIGTVEEVRYEGILSLGRAVSPRLDLRVTAGGEYSTLAQVGAGGLSRKFWRPKGSVSAAWRPAADLRVNLKLQRQVGQLKFSDFLASADLVAQQSNAGNPDLRPPQSWEGEAEAIRSLGALGTTTLRAYVHRIDDIVDIVPVGATGEAVGNIDKAWRYGIEWKTTLILDRLGWRGARFDSRFWWQGSRLKDPLTGVTRQISDSQKHKIVLGLRQDVPNTNWSWGSDLTYDKFSLNTRLTEVGRQWEGPVWLSGYVERKNFHGLTFRAQVSNILGADSMWQRTVFAGRRLDPVAYYERRDRPIGQIFSFTVSGRF